MKPLKWYIAQEIVNKIIEDIKTGAFDIDNKILLKILIEYSNK